MSWITQKISGATFLSWQPLLSQGVNHGFGSAELNYHSSRSKEFEVSLSVALGAKSVFQARQVHGRDVFDTRISKETCLADIIIGQLPNKTPDGVMFIKTADCVPLIGVGSTDVVLIHAGWRGLAGGAIEEGLRRINGLSSVLIGPSANECCYEVGKDVVDALDKKGVYTQREGRYFLSTAKTAAAIASSFIESGSIISLNKCTICDPRYNSYRRSGNEERNITFAQIFCDAGS